MLRKRLSGKRASQFSEDGKFTLSQLALDFSCKNCHNEEGNAAVYTDRELMEKAYNYHKRPDQLP